MITIIMIMTFMMRWVTMMLMICDMLKMNTFAKIIIINNIDLKTKYMSRIESIIPPALWATGGLEESANPHPNFPPIPSNTYTTTP